MRNLMIAAATAALFAAGPAMAGGVNVSESFSVGASGSALTKGGVEGGSYAKGKNGSDAYAFSKNYVTNTGVASVGLGWAKDTRTAMSFGMSVAKTNGKGAVAEAFETRDTFGKSKSAFGINASGNYSGYGFPGTGWGVGGVPGVEFGEHPQY